MTKSFKYIIIGISIILLFGIALYFLDSKGTSALVESNSPYLPKANPLGSGVENIYLINVKDDSSDSGWKNAITYVDQNNNPTANVFMDTFVMLGSNLTRKMTVVKEVNSRVNEINSKNNSKIKVNIIMGVEGGTGYKSIVDNTISSFNSAGLSNLKLIGFYWSPESIYINGSSFNLVTDFNKYVHNKGYKTLWIPYITGYDRPHNGDGSMNLSTLNSACSTYSSGLNVEPCNAGSSAFYTTVNGIRMYKDELYLYGYKYGFDFVSLQSNYVFHGNNPGWNKYRSGSENTIVDRLKLTDQQVLKMKASVEVELDPDSSNIGAYYGNVGCQRYKEWLKYGIPRGWNKSINVYYFYAMFSPSYLSQGGLARSYYDVTYKYAKGTLTLNDVDMISCDRGYYSNYQNVSKNKSYTSNLAKYTSAPDSSKTYGYNYVDASGSTKFKTDSTKYCKYGKLDGNTWTSSLICDDGVKLTDGVFGKSAYSAYDEWVGVSIKNDTKPYTIVVDLGSKVSSLTYYALELNNHISGGIVTFPRNASGSAKVYVSDDGKSFTSVGELSAVNNRNIFEAMYYELKTSKSYSGRYVKFEITYNDTSGVIYISEAIVGKTSTVRFDSDTSTVDISNSNGIDVSYNVDNVGSGNLIVSSSNANIASVSISNGTVHIVPIGAGEATITLSDKQYGTKATHKVTVTSSSGGGSSKPSSSSPSSASSSPSSNSSVPPASSSSLPPTPSSSVPHPPASSSYVAPSSGGYMDAIDNPQTGAESYWLVLVIAIALALFTTSFYKKYI